MIMGKSAYKVSTENFLLIYILISYLGILRQGLAGSNSAAQPGLKFTVIFLPQPSAWITGVSYNI